MVSEGVFLDVGVCLCQQLSVVQAAYPCATIAPRLPRALVEDLATACVQFAPPRRLPGRPRKRQADDPERLDQNRTSCQSDSRGSIWTASSAAQEGESVTAPCTIAKHLLTTLASAQINFSNVTIPTLFTGHNTYLILTPPFSHLVCSILSCIYLYVTVNEKRDHSAQNVHSSYK